MTLIYMISIPMPTLIASEQLVFYYVILIFNMDDRPCRDRLNLFPSTKVNNMFEKILN